MRVCYLDFEYNGISEKKLNLVCASVLCTDNGYVKFTRDFWLFENPSKKKEARNFFKKLIDEGYVFVAYVMEAEARSLLSLFDGDTSWLSTFRAIDLYLEYRCLLNQHHKYAYGEQYIKGKVIKTVPPPPKWERSDSEEDEAHHKPEYSLAAATFKILDEKIDTDHKTAMRDIIIRGGRAEIQANMTPITEYCASDVKNLPRMLLGIRKAHLSSLDPSFDLKGDFEGLEERREKAKAEWLKAAILRGDYAVRTARMLALGYPVNMQKISLFTQNISSILAEAASHCLEVAPEVKAFRWAKKDQKWTMCEKPIRDWVASQKLPHWRMTDGGKSKVKKLSLSKDAFRDWFDSSSPGFAGAFCRYLKTKQSLNGFIVSKTSKKGVFTDFVGSDNRVRPYFGIYGSQTSRSQPGSIGFIPLKAHWMRNFLEAPPGRALCGIDYASQEFLIAAILSQDAKMIEAYESGDVYLAFGKDAGLIPKDGTKKTHPIERDCCKTTVLGISYDLTAKGLAPRLSAITGKTYTEVQAEALIDLFYSTYSDYEEWKVGVKKKYQEDEHLMLPDGWVMWGDQENMRSVGNFPVQGHGGVIMREAVRLAQDQGVDIVFTLHDALYAEIDSYDMNAIKTLMSAMQQAFQNVMSRYGVTSPIRLEGEVWSKDYATLPCSPPENVKMLCEYTDEKGQADLDRYRKYFCVDNTL
jgi:hypothetical protein